MSGYYGSTMPQLAGLTGSELVPFDTQLANGQNPQSAVATSLTMAIAQKLLATSGDITTVAGTRYVVGPIAIGLQPLGDAQPTSSAPIGLTGIKALVGSVGGTDLWIAELHDVNGNLLATSATAGTTAGTATQPMLLPFTAVYGATPGQYYIAIQSNGTTAKIAGLMGVSLPVKTGSFTGTFGTGAAFTPPTTYTAALGPVAMTY